jgi:hypothetical protein
LKRNGKKGHSQPRAIRAEVTSHDTLIILERNVSNTPRVKQLLGRPKLNKDVQREK